MPSPFPGMDPYLEDPGVWPDFHATFINYCRESIADQLPPNFVARVREQIRLVDLREGESSRFEPDVNVSRSNGPSGTPGPAAIGAAGQSTIVDLEDTVETRELSLEIIRFPEQTV